MSLREYKNRVYEANKRDYLCGHAQTENFQLEPIQLSAPSNFNIASSSTYTVIIVNLRLMVVFSSS